MTRRIHLVYGWSAKREWIVAAYHDPEPAERHQQAAQQWRMAHLHDSPAPMNPYDPSSEECLGYAVRSLEVLWTFEQYLAFHSGEKS